MLGPDSRAVLLHHLAPPVGSALDAAVATTFTLDLDAAMVPALALSSHSGAVNDPIALLEAIRQTTRKLDIFCQAGSIAIPSQASDLMAFLEPMVHEVKAPPGGVFHPKCWFLRYANSTGELQFRLLILTRNLTNDTTWDAVVRLDSTGHARKPDPRNKPLSDFIRSLPRRSLRVLQEGRKQRIEELATQARRIAWERPEGVDEMLFHYLSGRGSTGPDLDGATRLVISPFLDDACVRPISQQQRVTVVSRQQDLERLAPETLAALHETFLIDAMAGLDDSGERVDLTNLHAKMTVVEPFGRRQVAHFIVGSANATQAAMKVNVEFMVEFRGRRKVLGTAAFLGADAPFRSLLRSYSATGGAEPSAQEDHQRELENVLRRLAQIPHSVRVERSDEADVESRLHSVRLSTGSAYGLPDGWRASLELLTLAGRAVIVDPSAPVSGVIEAVLTADLTPFVVLRVTTQRRLEGGTVLRAELSGAPDDRLDVVLARQIDTPEKFLRFLFLMLSLGNPYLLAQLDRSTSVRTPGLGLAGHVTSGAGLLELILEALSERPSTLSEIESLVSRLQNTEKGRALLPRGFTELWETVQQTQRMIKEWE